MKEFIAYKEYAGNNYLGYRDEDGTVGIIKNPMSKTKDSLEEEKLAANNQMDQDHWAEKGSREEVEKELRDDLDLAKANRELAIEDMTASTEAYRRATSDYIHAGEALAKFLEDNKLN